MRVSACLIVKDEELYLDTCLSRLIGFADEVVIVDTGSVDRSRDIARSHGANLIDVPWADDFSCVRNIGLAHATGDWILYIDADEHFDMQFADKSCLADPHAIAATVSLRAARTLTPYRELRLFRNRPDLRFQSVIHETIRPAIHAVLERDAAARIVASPYSIMHYGYEGDLTHKHHRNISMLRRATAEDPGRIYLWHTLGECLLGLGDVAAAQQAWREGLALVRAGTGDPGDALIYADLMSLHFGDNAIKLDDIDLLLDEAGRNFDKDPLILWYNARRLLQKGNSSAAVQQLKLLEALGPDGPQGAELGYDLRLFGEFAWALLGSCALTLGACTEAADYFARALAANPGSVELRTKLQLAKFRAAQRPAQVKPA
jgi:hypothetical protein